MDTTSVLRLKIFTIRVKTGLVREAKKCRIYEDASGTPGGYASLPTVIVLGHDPFSGVTMLIELSR